MQNTIIPPCFYRVSIKALILDTKGKFLLCKEKSGIWDLPWGGLDEWESIWDWLKREIKEEMWLDILEHRNQPSYFFKFTDKNWKEKINAVYETQVKNLDFIPSDECMEIWFFNREEMESIQVFPNVKEFIKIFKLENHVHL